MSDNQTNLSTANEGTGGSEEFSWRNLPGGDDFAEGMAEYAKITAKTTTPRRRRSRTSSLYSPRICSR
jgi:hypothetical protein